MRGAMYSRELMKMSRANVGGVGPRELAPITPLRKQRSSEITVRRPDGYCEVARQLNCSFVTPSTGEFLAPIAEPARARSKASAAVTLAYVRLALMSLFPRVESPY
jgi:hypothetical protein